MSHHSNNRPSKGIFYVLIAAFLWAAAGVLAKQLFSIGISPQDLVQARISIAFVTLLLSCIVMKRAVLKVDKKDLLYFMILGVGGLAAVQFTYFYAIKEIDIGVALAIQYTSACFIVLYGLIFLRQLVSRQVAVSLLLAVIGCYLVIGAYEVPLSEQNLKGIMVAFLSAIIFAFYTVYGEKGLMKYSSITVFLYVLLFAALFWNVIHKPMAVMSHSHNMNTWTLIVAISIFGTLIPFILYFLGLQMLSPVQVSITATMEPIFATLMAYIALGEQLSILQLSGGLFIIISVLIMSTTKKSDQMIDLEKSE